MPSYQIETTGGVYQIDTEEKQPMFKTEAEGRSALEKAKAFEKQAAFEASPIGFPVTQALAVANRAINTATGNAPEILANLAGQTTRPITESDIARGTGEAIGFIIPTGAPMRAIKAAEIIKNPLTRSVVQGAGAMATQLPTADKSTEEYLGGVATGGALGAAGRGVEKVAEGAIQQGAKALSGRIHDYLVKMPTGSFKFSKNPIKVMSDEAIVANNMDEYAQKAGERLAQRNAQLEAAVQNSDKTVDISDMVNKHLDTASQKLSGSLKDRTSKIEELNTIKSNLESQYGDLKSVPIKDAIKLKRQLADDFPFTQENAGDITTKAAHKIYHDINQFVEAEHPEIAELNQRVSGLIDIRNAARNRMVVESRNNPVGMVGRLAGIGAAGIGIGAGVPVEGLLTGLGIMGIEKAVQSPAVLTRVAKALSAMSGDDRLKVLKAYPELNNVIKVDARDIEILPKEQKQYPVANVRRNPKAKFVEQKNIGYDKPLQIEGRKIPLGLPNLPAEGVYRSVREPSIKLGAQSGEGVIPMGQKALTIEQGAAHTPVRPIVQEQGETIVPVRRQIIPLKKSETVVGSKEGSSTKGKFIFNKKGQIIIPSKSSFTKEEQPVADAIKKGMSEEEFVKSNKIAYHGTDAEFNVFDEKKIGSKNDLGFFGKGIYFSEDAGEAKSYGKNIIEANLNLKKPFDLRTKSNYLVAQQMEMVEKLSSIEELVKKEVNSENGKITLGEVANIINEVKNKAKISEHGNGGFVAEYKQPKGFELQKQAETKEDAIYLLAGDVLKYKGIKLPDPSVMPRHLFGSENFSDILKKNGFDSVRAENEIVVFSPSQIKTSSDLRTLYRQVKGKLQGGLTAEEKPVADAIRKGMSEDEFVKSKANLYHGTDQEFEHFSKEMLGKFTGAKSAKKGFFFTNNKKNAELYAGRPLTKAGADKINADILENERLYNESQNIVRRLNKDRKDFIHKHGVSPEELDPSYTYDSAEYTDDEIAKFVEENKKFSKDVIEEAENYNKTIKLAYENIKNSEDELRRLQKLESSTRGRIPHIEDLERASTEDIKYLTREKKPNIKNVSLDINNPLVVDGKHVKSIDNEVDKAISGGYDALILKGIEDPILSDVFVVFSPTQIKTESDLRSIYRQVKEKTGTPIKSRKD